MTHTVDGDQVQQCAAYMLASNTPSSHRQQGGGFLFHGAV